MIASRIAMGTILTRLGIAGGQLQVQLLKLLPGLTNKLLHDLDCSHGDMGHRLPAVEMWTVGEQVDRQFPGILFERELVDDHLFDPKSGYALD